MASYRSSGHEKSPAFQPRLYPRVAQLVRMTVLLQDERGVRYYMRKSRSDAAGERKDLNMLWYLLPSRAEKKLSGDPDQYFTPTDPQTLHPVAGTTIACVDMSDPDAPAPLVIRVVLQANAAGKSVGTVAVEAV